MKRILLTILLIFLLSVSCYAGSSTNYIISTEVIAGSYGGAQTSSNYSLEGLSRDHEYQVEADAAPVVYKLAGGFFNAIFGDLILNPIIQSISPNSSSNNNPVTVLIYVLNLQTGATAKLVKAGETDITGESYVYNIGSIQCDFNVTGKALGSWSVVVTNPDSRTGTLTDGFTIARPKGKPKISKLQNYPNPFNPNDGPTKIYYELDKPASISIHIYNIKGERIWVERFSAGQEGGKQGANNVYWNGDYSRIAASVPNGAYVYIVLYNNKEVLDKGTMLLFR